jgi:hypothetical protein
MRVLSDDDEVTTTTTTTTRRMLGARACVLEGWTGCKKAPRQPTAHDDDGDDGDDGAAPARPQTFHNARGRAPPAPSSSNPH